MIASFKTGDYTYNSIPALGKEQADTLREMGECLIPIRIELEVDGVRFRDTFTWNIYGNNFIFVTTRRIDIFVCRACGYAGSIRHDNLSGFQAESVAVHAAYCPANN
jgi:hypothetical protein